MPSDQKSRLLLADSSSLFRFFEAGADIVEAVMDALGDRLYIVADVEKEIRDHANDPQFRNGAAAFLKMLEHPPIVLPEDVRERVTDALKFNKRFGKHRDEDKGETPLTCRRRRVVERDRRRQPLCRDMRRGNTARPSYEHDRHDRRSR
jgi:hypothetical protein